MPNSRKVVAVVATGLLLLTGCSSKYKSGGPTKSAGQQSTIMRTALSEDVGSIDPDNNFEVSGLGMINGIYQGLLRYAPGTSRIEGQLATKWTASNGGRTYTFTLRDGVKFHDGTTMTSANVKASFERRIKHQDLLTGYFLGNVRSLSVPDKKTIVVNLKSADQGFLDSLCSPWGPKVIGPDALNTHAGKDYSKSWLSGHADGTGPYMLQTYDRGNQYVIKRFDRYWGAKPYFSEYQIKIVPSVAQQVLQLRAGELDFIDQFPFAQLNSMPKGLKVVSWSTIGMELAIVNTHRIASAAARQRIAAAINPSQWVSQTYHGYATPAKSNFAKEMLTPPIPWSYPKTPATKAAVPAVTVSYASNDVNLQAQVADRLIAQLQAAGISATARVLPTDQFNNTAKDAAHAPDIMLVHFYPDSAFPGSLAYLVYQCGTPLNYLAYCSKKADSIFQSASVNPDKNARDAQYLAGAKIGFDAGSFLGLMDLKDIIVYRGDLADLVTTPALPWNFDYALAKRST